jgi:hypothetical protein
VRIYSSRPWQNASHRQPPTPLPLRAQTLTFPAQKHGNFFSKILLVNKEIFLKKS